MISITGLRRKLRGLTLNKCIIILIISVILFNEYFIYTFQSMRWKSISSIRDSNEEMVVLLVSDPQIIGIQDEKRFPVGPLARWDSDRYVIDYFFTWFLEFWKSLFIKAKENYFDTPYWYLRCTFSRAYRHINPDVIVFLGDLMDEGSKATDAEYVSYVSRFNNIFHEIKKTKSIIVPGDNDIGGEGGDFRTPFKIHRFEQHFGNLTGIINHKFIDFLKLDIRQNYDGVSEKKQLISSFASHMKAPIRLIVNHESMMVKFKSSIYPIFQMAQPSLLLSGHWHLSQIITCDTCLSDNADMYSWPYRLKSLEKERDFIDIDFNNLLALNELMVPTCSYRMGVPYMGYGVAVINKSGSMKYIVLWLPSRYTILYIYLIVLGLIITVWLINFILTPDRENKSFYS